MLMILKVILMEYYPGQGNWGNGLNAFAVGEVGGDKQIGSNTANSVTALT